MPNETTVLKTLGTLSASLIGLTIVPKHAIEVIELMRQLAVAVIGRGTRA